MKEQVDTQRINKTIRFIPLNLVCEYTKEDGTKDYGLMSWSIKNGYPRVSVNTTGVRTESIDYTKLITAPFDYINLLSALDDFEKVIASEKDTIRRVDCLNNRFKDGKRTDEIYVQATVYFIKDKEGIIYISVLEQGKQKLKFKVVPKGYVRFYDDAGNVIDNEGERSKRFSLKYLQVLRMLMEDELKIDAKFQSIKNNNSSVVKPSNPDVEVPIKVVTTKVETENFDLDKMLEL